MIEIILKDERVKKALARLSAHASDPSPALRAIGDDLVESTKKRFASTSTPDGKQWAPNKPSTLDHKSGSRPLTDHGTLQDTINYQLHGKDTLLIGSPLEYAAMQQFGGKKSEFPNLWGDIPAREFLGLSDEDTNQILKTIGDYITS